MNSKGKLKKNSDNSKKCVKENRKSIRLVAFCLATIMLLSVFAANIPSIIDLLTTTAAAGDTYYTADFTLYDYFGTTDSSGKQWFNDFNNKLYTSGYVTGAGTYNSSNQSLFATTNDSHTYYPLYLGLQYNDSGTQYPWISSENQNVNVDTTKYRYSLAANSEAKSSVSAAAQGLVDSKLDASGNVTQGNGATIVPYFNTGFLTSGIGSVSSGKKFRFKRHTTGEYAGYYVFDSKSDGLAVSGNTYTADDTVTPHKDENGANGFFPLGSGNYGFGAKFEIDFTMTTNGKTPSGNDMTFNFKGDDDVWVFIDGQLVLDIGGAHGAVSGNINFGNGTSYVSAVKNASAFNYSNALNNVGSNITKDVTTDITSILNSLNIYGDPTQTHKLTVFYMERGRIESNCLITFNFEEADSLTVENNINTENVNEAFKTDTLAVAMSEGIEYVLANKGDATATTGPDDNKTDLDEELKYDAGTQEKVNINYYNGIDNTSPVAQFSAYPGQKVMLSSGSNLTRDNYKFVGWSSNPNSSTVNYPTGSLITVPSGGMNLYAVWDISITLDSIPLPVVVLFINSSASTSNLYSNTQVNGSNYPFTLAVSGQLFCNYTNVVKLTSSSGEYQTWWKYKYGAGNEIQYPGNNSWVTDNTGDQNGDSLKLKGGYLYTINTNLTQNQIDKYYLSGSSLTSSNSSSEGRKSNIASDIQKWYIAYHNLYNQLVSAKNTIENYTTATYDENFVTAYESALDTYLNATWSTSASTLNSATTSLGGTAAASLDYEEIATLSLDDETDPDVTFSTTSDSQKTDVETTNASDEVDAANSDEETTETSVPETNAVYTGDDAEPNTVQPLAASGANSTSGHWVGSPASFGLVKQTNYRLKYISGTASVVRQTQEGYVNVGGVSYNVDGKFNLLSNQSAKFSMQFMRESYLKVAQTGNSYYYPDSTKNTAVLKDGDGNITHQGIMAGVGNFISDSITSSQLSQRYSTSWKLSDNNGDGTVIASSYDGYSAYNKSVTAEPGSFIMDYINATASSTEFVDLTVSYENTVLVGDLEITKELTDSAQTHVEEYAASHDGNTPDFTFTVNFSNVFGGDSASKAYSGEYYVTRVVGGVTKYVDASGQEVSSKTARTTSNGEITIKAGDTIIIKNIPVDTKYTVTETLPDGSAEHVIWNLTKVIDGNNSEQTVTNNAVSGTIKADVAGTTVDSAAQYLASYTPYTVDTPKFSYTFLNDLNGAYIIITKKINELYYGATDNPANLFGTGATVGGVTLTDDEKVLDPNGYEKATEAEQTFIFKITEYANSNFTGATNVFYETISFDKNASIVDGAYSDYKVICVDPNKSYKVEEVENWSWKYKLDSVTVTSTNAVTNNVANISKFDKTCRGYGNAAEATFTNNKKTDDTEDVEGDTSIMINIIGKAS